MTLAGFMMFAGPKTLADSQKDETPEDKDQCTDVVAMLRSCKKQCKSQSCGFVGMAIQVNPKFKIGCACACEDKQEQEPPYFY